MTNSEQMDRTKREKITKICFVSKAAFALASPTYQWATAAAEIAGLAPGLLTIPELPHDIRSQYAKLTKVAFDKTKAATTKDSHLKILNELAETTVIPEDLEQVIQKTEAYRRNYSTGKDAEDIVRLFEVQFKETLPEYPELARMYLLSNTEDTLERLKELNAFAVRAEANFIHIKETTDRAYSIISTFDNMLTHGITSLVFLTIAIGLFLLFSNFWGGISPTTLLIALGSLFVSEFLVFFIKRNSKNFVLLNTSSPIALKSIAFSFAITPMVTASVFIITGYAVLKNLDENVLKGAVILLLCHYVSLFLKYCYEEKFAKNDDRMKESPSNISS